MNKKIMKYIVAFFLFLIVGGIITAKPSLAATADIEITADSTDVTLGDNVFIYITITSDVLVGDVEANLTYDDDILGYLNGPSVIKGSSGFLKISDVGVSKGTDTRKYTLKFEALKVGISEVSFSGPSIVYDYETGDGMPVSSNNDLTINVKAAETASDNAFLQSLKISPSQLTTEFDKNSLEYHTTIGYETERLIIDALPEDENATVSILGNDFLKEGENKIIITVLAESGAVIEYIVNVFREFAPTDDTTQDSDISPETIQSLFEVMETDGKIYALLKGKYQLIEPDSEVKIPEGYIKTKIIISENTVNTYSLEDDLDSDFLLIYAMNDRGEKGFYQYDRIEKTMQRYVPEEANGFDNTVNPNIDEIMQSDEYHSNLNKAAFVIAILCVICILLITALIRLYMKSRGYKEDDLN